MKHPQIVFEVLSPSNVGRRWTSKTFEYWNMPSIRQFVTIDATQRYCESFVRDDFGEWQPVIVVEGVEPLVLPSMDFEMSLGEMYRGTSLA